MKKRFINNSLLVILDTFLNLAMNFVIIILIAKYVEVELLGQYQLYITVIGLSAILANFGINVIINREIAKNPNKVNLYISNVLTIRFFISLPLLFIISTLVFYISGFSNIYLFFLVLVLNFLLSISSIFGGVFNSLHKNSYQLKMNLIYKTFSLMCAFLFLTLGSNLYMVISSFIIVSIISNLYAWIVLHNLYSSLSFRYDKRFIKKIILTSLPLVFASFTEFLSLKVDTYMIGIMIDEKSVGYYSVSYNLFLGATLIPLAVTKVFFPNFIDMYSKDKNQANKFILKIGFLFTVYAFWVGAVFYFLNYQIMDIFYDVEKFFPSIDVIKYLSFALIFIVLNRLYNYALLALKYNNYYFRISLITAIINILLNISLIPKYGINGAVYATIISEFVLMILSIGKFYVK
ncbi:flippase [Poseidonibacter lekithochrous]|uniref:flippase n=1 Tax=Poseidonibacter lekithochrous TaxID=1904463 RepID=UPI000D3571A5|nr:flippase [Poseidonibacter lekithochrous]